MTTGRRVAVLLTAALLAPGPVRAQAGVAAVPVLAFTVTDSALRGPAAFTAGVVTLQLANRGRRVHQLQLLRITQGHTAAEATAFLRANDGRPPWTEVTIGAGPVEGGQTIAATVKLAAGTYLLLDPLPDAQGRTNYRAGIMMPFTGTGVARRDLANIPAVAGLIVAGAFRFGNLLRSGNTWTQAEVRNRNTKVRPGLQTIRIESFATRGHSVVLARGGLEIMRQYAQWRDGRRPAPPVGLVGGVPGLPGESRAFLQVRLTPGGYILFCPEREPTGLYGFETGEFTQFVVQ